MLRRHKEDRLSINGAQTVKVEKGTTEFENYFKEIPGQFKIYAEFECNLESVEIYEGSYIKRYHDHIPCSFAYKVVCIDDKFNKPIVVFRGEMLLMNLLKQFLRSMNIAKK